MNYIIIISQIPIQRELILFFIFQLDLYFEQALKDKRCLIIKHMATDGACLFRAVGKHDFLNNLIGSLFGNTM